jgi:hypothetical protein
MLFSACDVNVSLRMPVVMSLRSFDSSDVSYSFNRFLFKQRDFVDTKIPLREIQQRA